MSLRVSGCSVPRCTEVSGPRNLVPLHVFPQEGKTLHAHQTPLLRRWRRWRWARQRRPLVLPDAIGADAVQQVPPPHPRLLLHTAWHFNHAVTSLCKLKTVCLSEISSVATGRCPVMWSCNLSGLGTIAVDAGLSHQRLLQRTAPVLTCTSAKLASNAAASGLSLRHSRYRA